MNYENKYKQLYQLISDLYPHMSEYCKEKVEGFFPELQESEDERIRKALIENFKFYGGDFLKTSKWGKNDDLLVTDIIAWLEKQGKRESDNVKPKFKPGDWVIGGRFHPAHILNIVKDKYEIEFTDNGAKGFHPTTFIDKHFHIWTIEDAKDGDVLTYLLDDGKELIMIYEGLGRSFDGEIYPHALLDGDGYFDESVGSVCCKFMENLIPATKEQQDLLFQKMADAGYEWDDEKKELRGKQESTNKVEPRFKVGDWIVYDGLGIYKIVEIHEGWYSVIDSEDRRWSVMFEKESLCHIWTINDAKDGDILTLKDDKGPFIFQGFSKYHPGCPVAYCGIDAVGTFMIAGFGWWANEEEEIEPATKEQRDFLFAIMKKAGYEWDAEKKELIGENE